MLVELAVRNLGVIPDARIPFAEGLVALTGETGAGKTMIVEALDLLAGGRGDPGRVRPGEDEAVVEALLVLDGEEYVVRRVVPSSGRSRAYLNGELSTAPVLAELLGRAVEVHGQHGQQVLLSARHQRLALDRFAGVETSALRSSGDRVTALEAQLEHLTGDGPSLAREVDYLQYQVREIEQLAPEVDEEERLEHEEDLLAGAVGHRDAATVGLSLLADDGAAAELLARAAGALRDREPFGPLADRLAGLEVELTDLVAELRAAADQIEPDDERLAAVRARRQALVQLRRKYGEHLSEVLVFLDGARARLEELSSVEASAASVRSQLEAARAERARVAAEVGAARRAAAPELAAAIAVHLSALALPDARVEVAVADGELPGAGDRVEFLLAAHPGAPLAGLAKVASGGELSRVMLALRLVLSGGPSTMVFDEVDAGIGGTTATAVGAALAGLAADRQVVVVTHLAQVAAFADQQVQVAKQHDGTSTATTVSVLDDDARVVELSRMLSGSPDSAVAHEHAVELLAASQRRPGRTRVR
ncbi:MAG: DNA repair protein RecN [Actinomycetes bacterium]